MRESRAELQRFAELLPNLDKGGNLIFSVYANREKLASIAANGARPRRGEVKAASFFPHVVSLGATETKGRMWSLRRAMDTISPSLALTAYIEERSKPPHFKYAFVLDPHWVRGHIEDFRGVGEHTRSKHYKDRLRVNALSALSIKPVSYDVTNAHSNEVHYLGGTLPPEAFAGIVNNNEDVDAWRADVIVKDVIRELRQDKMGPHIGFALYDGQGQLYDVL